MGLVSHLTRRDGNTGMNTTAVSLLATLLVLVTLGIALVGAFFFLRAARRSRNQTDASLPLYEKRQSGHRSLTITASSTYNRTRDSVVVSYEKQELLSHSTSPPPSPVPEIRITFPDEVDDKGNRQSGRVVVVRVGEHSVGLEPLHEDLPPYQRDASDRFDSLDLDRIGGLKEKNEKEYA